MGAKFGHFSVLENDTKKVIQILKTKKMNDIDLQQFKETAKKLDPNYEPFTDAQNPFLLKLIRMMNTSIRTYYVGSNGKWITIFNDTYGWGSAEQACLEFSLKCDKLCFSASLFDSDVFTLTIFKNGEMLTQHVSGYPEAYDTPSVLGNADIIADTFDVSVPVKNLKDVLWDKELDNKITELERILNIKLWGIYKEEVEKAGWVKTYI